MIKRLLAFVTISGVLAGISLSGLFNMIHSGEKIDIGLVLLIISAFVIFIYVFIFSTSKIENCQKKYLLNCYVEAMLAISSLNSMWSVINDIFHSGMNNVLKMVSLFLSGIVMVIVILLFIIWYFNNANKLRISDVIDKTKFFYYPPSENNTVYIKPCYPSRELIQKGYETGFLGVDDVIVVFNESECGILIYANSANEEVPRFFNIVKSQMKRNLQENEEEMIYSYFLDMDSCINYFRTSYKYLLEMTEFVVGITNQDNGGVDIYKVVSKDNHFTISQMRYWDPDLRNYRYLSSERVVEEFDVGSR